MHKAGENFALPYAEGLRLQSDKNYFKGEYNEKYFEKGRRSCGCDSSCIGNDWLF